MDEFMRRVMAIIPGASFEEDNDGQVVIYTNLKSFTQENEPTLPAGEEILRDMDTNQEWVAP